MPQRKPTRGVDFATVCEHGLKLPGVEVGTSYGTPALKVRGKLMVRLKEDGETFVLRVNPAAREPLMATDPETFYLTDHYLDWPYVLVRMAALPVARLPELLDHAWLEAAPAALVRARS